MYIDLLRNSEIKNKQKQIPAKPGCVGHKLADCDSGLRKGSVDRFLTMTMPPDCSAVHILMMGAIPIVVPWK